MCELRSVQEREAHEDAPRQRVICPRPKDFMSFAKGVRSLAIRALTSSFLRVLFMRVFS